VGSSPQFALGFVEQLKQIGLGLLHLLGHLQIGFVFGRPVPKPVQPADDVQNLDPIVQPCRADTKLAKLVASLENPEGATIFQLMCSTGWQRHTIRGANGERVYRIV
jgi:hypothetical protein